MDVPGYALRMRRRWVERGLPDYPMWIAAVIDSAALATAAVVVGQRGADPLPVTACLVLVALVPWVLELWGRPSAPLPPIAASPDPVMAASAEPARGNGSSPAGRK